MDMIIQWWKVLGWECFVIFVNTFLFKFRYLDCFHWSEISWYIKLLSFLSFLFQFFPPQTVCFLLVGMVILYPISESVNYIITNRNLCLTKNYWCHCLKAYTFTKPPHHRWSNCYLYAILALVMARITNGSL